MNVLWKNGTISLYVFSFFICAIMLLSWFPQSFIVKAWEQDAFDEMRFFLDEAKNVQVMNELNEALGFQIKDYQITYQFSYYEFEVLITDQYGNQNCLWLQPSSDGSLENIEEKDLSVCFFPRI